MHQAESWPLRFRRWAPILIAVLALANVRLAWRGVHTAFFEPPSWWDSPWHERHMAELREYLPADAVVGYAPDPTVGDSQWIVDFEMARFYLAPLRVVKTTRVDWLVVHSDNSAYFPANFARQQFCSKLQLAGGLTLYQYLRHSPK